MNKLFLCDIIKISVKKVKSLNLVLLSKFHKMKNFLKNLCPPFIYDALKKVFVKPRQFRPIWNTLNYVPLNGLKIYFDPSGPWQKQMMDGKYDSFLFDELKKMDLRGKTIFDIGAHIGYHSFYFSRLVGAQGRVYAFEPHPKNIERLKLILEANKELKGCLSLVEAAVSDRNGTEEFSLNQDVESGRSSGSFLGRADTLWDKSAYANRGFIKTTVKTVTVDSWIRSVTPNPRPDIIKIDVEGAEHQVLMGAKSLIEYSKPTLLMEIHSMQSMFDVAIMLTKLGYKQRIINKEADGRAFIMAKPS